MVRKKEEHSLNVQGDSTLTTTHSEFHPLFRTSFLDLCTFKFIFKLLKYGSHTPITYKEIPAVKDDFISEEIWKDFEPALDDWLQKKKGNLFKLYLRLRAKDFLLSGIFFLLAGVISFVQPFLIQAVSSYIEDEKESVSEGFMLSGLFLLGYLFYLFCLSTGAYFSYQMTYYVQGTLSTAILYKAVKLSNESRAKKPVAVIVNHLSTDMKTCVNGLIQFQFCWWAFILIVTSLVLLGFTIGLAPLGAAIGVILLLLPVSGYPASQFMKLYLQKMKFSDKRMRFISDIVSGIRLIKAYVWELPFVKRIDEIRNTELVFVRRLAYCGAVFASSFAIQPCLMLLAMFLTYKATGHDLDSDTVFPTITLVNMLNVPLVLFPALISMVGTMLVAFKRVAEFLSMEERGAGAAVAALAAPPAPAEVGDAAVSFSAASYRWPKREEQAPEGKGSPPTAKAEKALAPATELTELAAGALGAANQLEALDCVFPRGKLTMVVGPVGCGKSTLLSAILGNIPLVDGQPPRFELEAADIRGDVSGDIAYVAQGPFILGTTLGENVSLFDHVDADRLDRAITTSGLAADLALMPAGLDTIVGERGVTLSGGQRMRVAIARAVYAHKPLVLLDDPLAALDAHVGQYVFDHAICGSLAQPLPTGTVPTRVLVVNQLHLLPLADHIVVLEGGRVAQQGSYTALANTPPLSTYLAASALDSTDQPSPSSSPDLNDPVSESAVVLTEKEGADPVAQALAKVNRDRSAGEAAEQHAIAQFKEKQVDEKKIPEAPVVEEEENDEDDEENDSSAIQGDVWQLIGRFAGGRSFLIALAFIYAIQCVIRVLSEYWVVVWNSATSEDEDDDSVLFYGKSDTFFLVAWVCISFLSMVAIASREVKFVQGFIRVATRFHHKLFAAVIKAPVAFFDTTSSGRILNRFSKDIAKLDNEISALMGQFFSAISNVLTLAVYASFLSSGFLLIVFIPVGILLYRVASFYRPSARAVQRVDAVCSSKLFSRFGETVQGIDTLRAYGCELPMCRQVHVWIDRSGRAILTGFFANGWFSLVCQLIMMVTVSLTVLFILLGWKLIPETIRPYLPLCAVMLATSVGSLDHGFNVLVQLDAAMTSVQRIARLSEKAPEGNPALDWVNGEDPASGAKKKKKTKQPQLTATAATPLLSCPHTAAFAARTPTLHFRNVRMRYRPALPLALKGVTFSIAPGTRVGVCGRTGSGKSSLIRALFRMTEIEHPTQIGEGIFLEDVDVGTVPLHALRSVFALIPQEPTLFEGPILFNIDPTGTVPRGQIVSRIVDSGLAPILLRMTTSHTKKATDTPSLQSDAPVAAAGLHTHGQSVDCLSDLTQKSPSEVSLTALAGNPRLPELVNAALDVPVEEAGGNLSAGERQLVCILRAVVSRARVVCVDEATAAIDTETDALIQRVLRTEFAGRTLLIIAHRLNTIIDSDQILVMADGVVAEHAPPQALLADPTSLFARLAAEAALSEDRKID